MKTCLLLSGLARSVEASYENIYKSLIEPNNPDIFIHTWMDPSLVGSLDETIIKLFNPKKIIIEKQKTWNNTNLKMDRMMATHARAYTRQYFVDALYSAWYSMQQSNLLKEQYRLENDFVYDYAIRARFDINYNTIINCQNYDKNKIYVSSRGLPEEMVCDLFAFGGNDLMNIFCSAFNSIDYINQIRDQKDGAFCGEILVYETLKMFGISHEKINNLICTRINT